MTDEKSEERKHEGDICDIFSDFEAEYTKIEQIGRQGQYGTTWKCQVKNRDESIPFSADNPEFLAVKIVHKERFRQSGQRIYTKWKELQRNEITTLLLTRHPNIVRLYRVLEDAEHVYMVMEYLPGGELLDYITKSAKLTEFKVAHIIGQVLSALDYMHQRDIIHLDLKPENIMLEDKSADEPVIKLIDFGFAAILPRLEKMVGHRGTPYYMAPEVWRGQYDRAADVWATGVICFVMLFGFLPFYDDHAKKGKVNTRQIKKQIQRGFTNVTKKGCGAWFPKRVPVSGGAKRFMDHMLRKNLAERYTVVEALGDPWCRGHASKDTLPEIVMRGLAHFIGARENNRDLTQLAAAYVDPNSTKLESTGSFEAIYTQNGRLDCEEFIQRFGALTDMRRLEMEQLFAELDADGDGFISMKTLERVEAFHQLVSVDDRLMEVFERLDKDGDGVLNESDLQSAVDEIESRSVTVDTFGQVLDVRNMLQSSGSNVIDRDKFLNMLHPQHYTRVVESVREARTASQYGISLRQRSAMYYDLLRQCEEQDQLDRELRNHLNNNNNSMTGISATGGGMSLTLRDLGPVEEMNESMFSDDDGDLDVTSILESVPANQS